MTTRERTGTADGSGRHAAIAERVLEALVGASAPAVSPDGERVAFVVSRLSVEQNTQLSTVWIADTAGAARPRPVTGGDHDGSPAWSPDGAELAFTSRRGEKKAASTLHVTPLDGGETRTVATSPEAIADVAFSPDGRWIAYTTRVRDARYDEEDEARRPPRRLDTLFTRLDDVGWLVDRPNHVHVVPADGTAPPRALTDGTFDHTGLAWLADSSGLVTAAARHEDWDLDLAVDLYLVPLRGEPRLLTDGTGIHGSPSVSPDGSTVAFVGQDDLRTFPRNQHVGVVPLSGGPRRWVSTHLDRTFSPWVGSRAPRWLGEDALLATAEDRGRTHLFRVRVDGSPPEQLTAGEISVTAFDENGLTTVYCAGAVDAPADLYVLHEGHPRRLTDFGRRFAEATDPVPWERFVVACRDGSGEIDAWIMRPRGFDPDGPPRRHPVLVDVHGGPFTQYGEVLFDEAQMQAAAGFVVVMCNPRGSSGREESWGQAILGPKHPVVPGTGWGSVDVEDVLAVVDAALERYPFCDPDRVGMLGGSYGGWMATWLAGTTGTRFRAICTERAVNNLETLEFTSDIASTFRLELGRTHLDDPEEYARMSPIRFVRDIEVPLLILHSEDDLRCPVSQAEELFVAMRLLGKEATFYRFPGEGHELSRSGSPVHRRQRAEIILDWFAEHLALDAGEEG